MNDLTQIELKQRLEEAEEVIRAIRAGEVDALVIGDQAIGEEIFTLEGGIESYRSFMEAMNVGAAAFDTKANLLYANQALCELVGSSPEAILSNGLFSLLDATNAAIIRDVVFSAGTERNQREVKVGPANDIRHLLLTAGRMRLGTSNAVAVSFTDITGSIVAEQRKEAERTALAIMASAAEAVVVCDLRGLVTHANAAAVSLANTDPVGLSFNAAFALDFRGATGLMQGEDFLEVAAGGQAVQGVEALAAHSRPAKDVLVSAAPLVVGEGRVTGTVVTLVDLSRRKAAEKQQLLLMGELDHRVKNTLALVVSIANRTASTEETIDGFRRAFSGRIHALAATHNLLADRSWGSIRLGEMVMAELAPFVADLHAKLKIEGDEIDIRPRAAVALGLVVHELATNAVKYGALSTETGRISVIVTRGSPSIKISWIESGGPVVREPTKKGFGDTVISRSLQYSPNGGAEVTYKAEGVKCEIRIPAEDVEEAIAI
ncbi:PAS domain-containing protein [Rhizobium cauense]|nr:PAS domain-containing protein [Rhizobium cauense]